MDRRTLLKSASAAILLPMGRGLTAAPGDAVVRLPSEWTKVPREFSVAPFWFWNDRLTEAELAHQLDDFQAHGVHAFVIHPRAGLPRDIGWMSDAMLDFMQFTIEEAARRKMWVILYDEGMYPSGSSSGQVVAQNPAYRTRGLFAVDLDTVEPGSEHRGFKIDDTGTPVLEPGQNLVAIVPRASDGHRIAVIDRAIRDGYSVIRGLHFRDEDPPRRSDHREVPENAPPAADILNPESVQCYIRLVYQRFYDRFGDHFGKTVKAVFTDEPSILGRRAERGAVAGTAGILEHVNEHLGYDFRPYLPTLWYGDEPNAARRRRDWHRALQARLEQTFYRQLSEWCASHDVALTGHPAEPDDIGHLRWFQIPGQDVVWRYIEPAKPSALEGSQSTQAKCASSAMIHLKRRRNLNECLGAFGHNLTYDEMHWLAAWLLVRGCNLLTPHAFYYSIRGPRVDERPPDVGPNSPWWPRYKPFADLCARLCWLNTDSEHVCHVAILGRNNWLPWQTAKVCFTHQIDFNYLEDRHLGDDARVDRTGIRIAGMHYKALILEQPPQEQYRPALEPLYRSGRIVDCTEGIDAKRMVSQLDELAPRDFAADVPAPGLRIRHVRKAGLDLYLLFNEGEDPLTFTPRLAAKGRRSVLDPTTGKQTPLGTDEPLTMNPHELKVIAL